MTITVSGEITLEDIKEIAKEYRGANAPDLVLYVPGESYINLLTDPEVGQMIIWTSPQEAIEPSIRLYGIKVVPYHPSRMLGEGI